MSAGVVCAIHLQVYWFWLDDMYMKVKLALPVNSNPGMVFPRQHFSDRNEQLRSVSSSDEVFSIEVQSH